MMDIVDDAVLVLDVISRGLTFAKGERLVGVREELSLVLCWHKKKVDKNSPVKKLQSNAIKGEKIILGFSDIFLIHGTFYNGNKGENNHFILDLFGIFPFNGVRL